MEREARRKLWLCCIHVLEFAETYQHRCSTTAEITSTPKKKEHWFLCTACPYHLQNLLHLHPKITPNFLLLGCPKGAKITIFRGPHVRLIFDRQTTNLLFKNAPKIDPKSRKMGVYFQYFFWCCSGTLFSRILSPKRSQNGTQKSAFFETSDLAKV